MAYTCKVVCAVLLLLCVTATIDASNPRKLDSGDLRGNGLYGIKKDFYYHISKGVCYVSLKQSDHSSFGLNIGFGGNGKASLSWSRGSRLAKVHAWVNGKASWWGKKSNHIRWTVWVWDC
jgi:hypothetical protein